MLSQMARALRGNPELTTLLVCVVLSLIGLSLPEEAQNAVSAVLSGVVLGPVNVATGRVRGTQVGLVNVARDLRGLPLGLINVVREGSFHAAGWVSELGVGYVGLEMGSRTFYTLAYAGMQLRADPDVFTGGLGLGLHVPVGPVFVNLDLSA